MRREIDQEIHRVSSIVSSECMENKLFDNYIEIKYIQLNNHFFIASITYIIGHEMMNNLDSIRHDSL